MGPVIDWIHQEGPRLGYRVPNPAERARATGRAQYLNELGLNDVQLYNAVGNHFDPDALRARIRGPLSRATRDGTALRHRYPTPADVSVMYQLVARVVVSNGIPSAPFPFPPDLVRILTATRSSGGMTDHTRPRPGGQQVAAEQGCQDQWQGTHTPRSGRCYYTPRARICCPSPNQEPGLRNANPSLNGHDSTSATTEFDHLGLCGTSFTKFQFPTEPRGQISLRSTPPRT